MYLVGWVLFSISNRSNSNRWWRRSTSQNTYTQNHEKPTDKMVFFYYSLWQYAHFFFFLLLFNIISHVILLFFFLIEVILPQGTFDRIRQEWMRMQKKKRKNWAKNCSRRWKNCKARQIERNEMSVLWYFYLIYYSET